MIIESLHYDVQRFRQALEACYHDLESTIFGSFPSGCCGAASELLAAFLQVQGYGAFTYVCGLRFDSNSSCSSHAWLEQGGYIFDITKDQFDKGGDKNFVTADHSWHDSHFPVQKKHETSGVLPPELWIAYARVQERLRGTR